MFGYIRKLARAARVQSPPDARVHSGPRIDQSVDANLATMESRFHHSGDFVTRKFLLGNGRIPAALVFVDGLTSLKEINDSILQPLMLGYSLVMQPETAHLETMEDIQQRYLGNAEAKLTDQLEECIAACLGGDAVLFVEGMDEALFINAKGWEKRSITEPQTETVVRGPREGFTETLRTNTSLIRRRIKSADLRTEPLQLGDRTNTNVCLVYIAGLANPKLVEELRQRLATINTDAILNSGYVESFIQDAPHSIFETVGYTEKPDVVAAKLLEGRVALIIDGTPFVLTVPLLFVESFQSVEDYSLRSQFATFLRFLRLLAFFISVLGPALYVALASFHQEMIPTLLLFNMAVTSEGLPFPAVVEAVIMLVTFEILKEAGVRLPKPVGQTISIVGALVMGQAAVQAGIVGAPVVIVVAITAVTGFLSPNVSDAVSFVRAYLLFLAAILGGFGITLGLITVLVHLTSLKSFGSPYLHPIAPFYPPDLKDTLWRAPLWKMRTRPATLHPQDLQRSNMSEPHFPDPEEGGQHS